MLKSPDCGSIASFEDDENFENSAKSEGVKRGHMVVDSEILPAAGPGCGSWIEIRRGPLQLHPKSRRFEVTSDA